MAKRAVLLVNLGSPDSTSVADVRRYLREFLGDNRVLDIWPPARWALLEGIILRTRPKKSAHAYSKVWTDEGSPLVATSVKVQQKLAAALKAEVPVYLGMRYGRPAVPDVIAQMVKDGIEEVLLFPQYPHYAMSSWETVVVQAYETAARIAPQLKLRSVQPFFGDSDYLDALAAVTAPALQRGFDHVLFSYHGIPERHLRQTDPSHAHCLTVQDCCTNCSPAHATCYRAQCFATTRGLVARLGLTPAQHSVSFQSRLAGEPWLKPFTDFELVRLPKEAGVKRLLILCPAFVADCLETLEEIAMAGRDTFMGAGGESYYQIPCLNDQPPYIDFLAGRVRRWLQTGAVAGTRGMSDGMSPESANEALTGNDALYAALLKADRSEALVPLAGQLAGELSEQLTRILGGIALARGGDLAALEGAETAALASREVVRRLMALGHKVEATRAEVSPKALLQEAIAGAAASHAAEITLTVDEGTGPVAVNRDEMAQAFRALVRNAAEAMSPAPQRPRIQILAGNTTLPEGQVAGLPAGDYVEFEVRDNGRGIPPEELDRIWEPFFTTKKHGAGLGLPSVLAAVRRHGGQVGVDSSAGEGTVFTIFLPIPAAAAAAAGGERGEATRFRTGRVLVMDSDEKNRVVLAGLLERLNYKCDSARDAEEAEQWYRRYWDINRPFDAVLIDLTAVNGRPEGELALARLLDLDPDVRAVAMAAMPPEELAAAAQEKGFLGWLAKPFKLSELGEALQTVIG